MNEGLKKKLLVGILPGVKADVLFGGIFLYVISKDMINHGLDMQFVAYLVLFLIFIIIYSLILSLMLRLKTKWKGVITVLIGTVTGLAYLATLGTTGVKRSLSFEELFFNWSGFLFCFF